MNVTIIGTTTCDFCKRAKEEAIKYNIPYEYKIINRGEPEEELLSFGTPITMDEAIGLVGRAFRTVPQILIDGVCIGGFEDFKNHLDRKNLDIDEFKDMDI